MKKINLLLIVLLSCAHLSAQISVNHIRETSRGVLWEKRVNVNETYDNVYEYDGVNLSLKKGNEIVTIFANNFFEISAPYSEENLLMMKDIEQTHANLLKQKTKNKALGFSISGILLILAADPLANLVTNNMTSGSDENAEDFSKRVKNTRNGIYWSMTSIGAIFEIIGISHTVKLASGAEFGYGLKNDGVTLSYKFK